MENNNKFEWPPLESDPEIFNSYFHKIGLPSNINFGELFSLDYKEIQIIEEPIIGVIATIQRTKGRFYENEKLQSFKSVPFYMKQEGSLDNACGLVAALHIFGNKTDEFKLAEDSILFKYFNQVLNKTPDERCKLLESNNDFKEAHMSSANEGQSGIPSTQDNVSHHYIAYVHHNGKVYELDGTIPGPISIKENVSKNDLLDVAVDEIKRKIELGLISESLSILYASIAN